MSVGKCLSCSRNGESCSEMANCDATSSEVLDLSTLTESVAGDDATERSEALGSRQVRKVLFSWCWIVSTMQTINAL